MKFDSYITSNTKTASTVKDYTEFLNKYEFDKEKFSLKKAAFTLAETLITLTIIGVIAALTIPSLISEYQKHTYVVGLKKAYSQLQNAMKMIPITQGCPPGDFDCVGWNEGSHRDENGHWVSDVTNIEGQEFEGNSENKRLYLLSKQFKINKLCYRGSTDPECIKATRAIFHSESTTSSTLFISNDGVIWSDYGTYSLIIDINGQHSPNKQGRDQFAFGINATYGIGSTIAENRPLVAPFGSKLYADIYNQPNYYWRNNNKCTPESINKYLGPPLHCTGRVLEEDAMNY